MRMSPLAGSVGLIETSAICQERALHVGEVFAAEAGIMAAKLAFWSPPFRLERVTNLHRLA